MSTPTRRNAGAAVPGTTQQHAVDWLRRAIVAGDLRPGDRMTQEDIAAEIGVSVAPVREALRVLEQEGQLTYLPRRGYFVTELKVADLEEIYELRRVVEGRAARHALKSLDDETLERIELAAADCVAASERGDVAAGLEANRRFHFTILDAGDNPHHMRVVRLLWDSTEAYRALYYNTIEERRAADAAHQRIVAALRAKDTSGLVKELDAHRWRALEVLRAILPADG